MLIKKKISSFSAIALLDLLLEKPHVSIHEIAEKIQISYPTAKKLAAQFHQLEIVKEITGKKRDKRYAYWEYLALLSEGT